MNDGTNEFRTRERHKERRRTQNLVGLEFWSHHLVSLASCPWGVRRMMIENGLPLPNYEIYEFFVFAVMLTRFHHPDEC